MKKKHNRLSALLLSMFMCISSVTLPVYAQDAGTETPIPEQEPETEVIVSEEPAETEEEPGEPEEPAEVIVQDEENPTDDTAIQEEPDPAEPEEQEPVTEEEPEPAVTEEPAQEEEADSSLFADPEDGYFLVEYFPNLDNVTRVDRDLSPAGYEVRAFYPQDKVIINMDFIHEDYRLLGWALSPEDAANGVVTYVNGQDLNTYFAENPNDLILYGVWEEDDDYVYINYRPMLEGATKVNGKLSDVGYEVRAIPWDEPAYINMEFIHPDYNFLGWALTAHDAESGIVKYHTGDNLYAYFENHKELTLYAVWEPKEAEQYKIRYYPTIRGVMDGGYVLSSNDCVVEEYGVDEDVIVNFTFVSSTHIFKGWALSQEDALAGKVKYQNGQNIGKYFQNNKHSLELYAVWEYDKSAKHIYYDPIYYEEVQDINNQLSGTGWFSKRFNKNDEVIVNQECIREGYVLKGWNTDEEKAKAGIVKYHNGDSLGKYFAKGAKDLILYAVWKDESAGGKVVYHPVIDGVITEDGEMIYAFEAKAEEFRADEDVEIGMTYTHPEFTFLGWATSEADAENGKVTYENGTTIGRYFADHDDNLNLYAVWKQDFGIVKYHPNRSGALPVKGWLSQSGYQARSFKRDENVVLDQMMIHPNYILVGWATTKKKADSGKADYEIGENIGTYFADKDELVLYGVWKAGKGVVTSVSVPEQTIYENWNASTNSYVTHPEDSEMYDLTPASITVKANGKTYKGSPEEVAADIEADINEGKPDDEKTTISVELSNMYASEGYMPDTAKIKVGGIGTTYKVKFVKNPVTVSIPQNTKIFEDDKDATGMYDFKPESMTVKAGKKTYTGDFDTVANKLGSAQKIEMQLTDWPYWAGAGWHAIRMDAEKYAGRGRGFALYGYTTEFVDGPIESVEASDLCIMVDGEHSVYYSAFDGDSNTNLAVGSVAKDRMAEAVYMTVTLKDKSVIKGQLADINKQLDEKYGSHYRNVRLEGDGSTRTLVIGSHEDEVSIVDSSSHDTTPDKVAIGKSITLKSDEKKVKWISDDTAIAKVTTKGKVTGVAEGVAPILAKYEGGVQVFYVEVVPAVTTVDISYRGTDDNYHGSVSGRTLKLDEDGFALKSAVYPENAIQEVTWTSSNNKIATIAEDGAVTRLKNGTVTFTAKAKDGTGKKASVKVTFATFVEDLQITGPAEVAAGKKVTLKTVATGINGKTPTNKAVTWKSSDTSIAKISSKGVVTAVKGKEGQSVTITAIAKDREGRVDEVLQTFTLNVTAPVTSVKLKDPAGEYINGKTVKVSGSSYTITPEIAGNESNTLKWTSAKTSVAEVDQNGVVTKKKNGTVKITAAATDGTGKKATVTLKFTD